MTSRRWWARLTSPRLRRRARLALMVAAAAVIGAVFYSWVTLPDVRPLANSAPEETAFMRLRAREAEADGRSARARRQWVPYGRISPHLVRAVVVTEDAAFWSHNGVDMFEVRAALRTWMSEGGSLRGGSTITQQLAKNLYLSPSRNPYRKVRELLIARRLEAELSKRRILELYLNLIEWGNGIWGAEAASRAYFGVSAADLSREQAALLAAAIASPRTSNPANPSRRLQQRQALILRRMGD